ncbi:chitin synthase-domain-containing protein [Cladorrhinum samala]|uniref:chitin synthase n=1 Tax=Cladorrhinum samala TaxID=585594 RepID=A0AAV9HFR0_9PEZI|nr:chitin synthase-domain-containing protein [Cladorrhinum samala]
MSNTTRPQPAANANNKFNSAPSPASASHHEHASQEETHVAPVTAATPSWVTRWITRRTERKQAQSILPIHNNHKTPRSPVLPIKDKMIPKPLKHPFIQPLPGVASSPGDNRISSEESTVEHVPQVQERTPELPSTSCTNSPADVSAAEPALVASARETKVTTSTANDAAIVRRGKKRMLEQKVATACCLTGLNFTFIFASWWWPQYWYIYFPFICLPLALNVCMIASITFFVVKRFMFGEEKVIPEEPENIAYVLACYNETSEECTKSLDSLVAQEGIDRHKQAIMIICDGKVRGPGMAKTTAASLIDDILVDPTDRRLIRGAYTAWDGQTMDVEVSRGVYRGKIPFLCIVKQQNQGKRDSLIVIRSFLLKFNRRCSQPDQKMIFSPRFFNYMTEWLSEQSQIPEVSCLVGMDCDTRFAPDCVARLLDSSRIDPERTVGVCGYVAVDFTLSSKWNPWSLYQSAEYTVAQGLRRLHQSVATRKVSCLPGCCQLLKVTEETCGDEILLVRFGYHHSPLDGMLRQIRATASEDRNHVCLMLTAFPRVQTRQALFARAYTDVPRSWSVFLSQRRRWTLGATANDLLLTFAGGTQWWERILALSNVVIWSLNVFVIASIACMVFAFIHQPVWILMVFVGVMLIPVIYYLLMTFWLVRGGVLERVQYLVGLTMFIVCGPFVNISILLYAVWNMDSFGWGKTRKVVACEDGDVTTEGGAQGKEEEENDQTRWEKGAEERVCMDEENQIVQTPSGWKKMPVRTEEEGAYSGGNY